MTSLMLLAVLLTTCSIISVSSWEAHDAIWKAIKRREYEHEVPPLRRDAPIFVNISMALLNVIDLDEVNEMMVSSWLPLLVWNDPRLGWDPAEYSNITELSLPAKVIWTPDVIIFNSLDDPNKSIFNPNYRVRIKNDGEVEWNAPGVVRSTCNIDVTYFPFDYQLCYIHMESTSTYAEDQTLGILEGVSLLNRSRMEDNELWHIVDAWVRFDEVQMGASFIRYHVLLRRKPVYYVLNVILPILVLSIIALLVFWLPAGSGEKMGLAVTVVLSFTVAQDTMSNIVPKTSDTLPLINIYVVLSSVMSALSLIASVFILRIKECVSRPPPRWLLVASQCLAGVCWCERRLTGSCRYQCNSTAPRDSKQEQQFGLLTMTTAIDELTNDHSNIAANYIDDDDDDVDNRAAVGTPTRGPTSDKNKAFLSQPLMNNDSHLIIVAELRALHQTLRATMEKKSKRRRAQEKDENMADEWDLIARVFDRFLFVVFLAINVGIIATCSYYTLVYNSQENAMHRED